MDRSLNEKRRSGFLIGTVVLCLVPACASESGVVTGRNATGPDSQRRVAFRPPFGLNGPRTLYPGGYAGSGVGSDLGPAARSAPTSSSYYQRAPRPSGWWLGRGTAAPAAPVAPAAPPPTQTEPGVSSSVETLGITPP